MKKKGREYTDGNISEALLAASEMYDGSLSVEQYKESKLKPSYMTILKRYHSFQAACLAAGVEYRRPNGREMDIDQIANALRKHFLSAGKLLTTTEYKKAELSPHVTTIYKLGISWSEAVELAGFDYNKSKEFGILVRKLSGDTSD
ncbi:hypothetical protein [Paenibacillus donghaensis]|uniref:Uncharacterized protein n=1 Tax=Paenibacillus donghaensis TaxID=414771 RepID=A0A2Z2KLT6_9BACL|nr:hypothetical protein [Paenibacillus donghaensis]ASA22062.1 hypothetical protein B9T62_15535 [Paenibacillus donghaensis]